MKRLFSAVFMLSFIFLFLAGCQGKPVVTDTPASQKNEKNMKIGVILSNEDMTVCQALKSQFEAVFKPAGAEMLFMSETDSQKQAEAVDKLLGEAVNLLVIQPAHDLKMSDIASRCKEKNVKIISFLGIPNAPVDLAVIPDYKKAGEIITEYVVGKTSDKAEILVLEDGPGSIKSKDFLIGCGMALRDLKDITLIKASDIPGSSSMKPTEKLEAVLQKSKPLAILCLSGKTAVEASAVLKKHSLSDKVKLAGMGTDTANLRLMFQRAQSADIYFRYDLMTKTAANAALALLKNRKPDGVTSLEINGAKADAIITDVEIVTTDNLKKFLTRVKVYNSDDIFIYGETTGTVPETPATATEPEVVVPDGEMTPHWEKTDSPPEVKPDEEAGKKPARIESTPEFPEAKPGERRKSDPVIRPGISPAPANSSETRKEEKKEQGGAIPMPTEKKEPDVSGSTGSTSESSKGNSSEKSGLEREISPHVDVTKPGSIR